MHTAVYCDHDDNDNYDHDDCSLFIFIYCKMGWYMLLIVTMVIVTWINNRDMREHNGEYGKGSCDGYHSNKEYGKRSCDGKQVGCVSSEIV